METEVGLAEFVAHLHEEVELFKLRYSAGIESEEYPESMSLPEWEEQFETWRF